MTGAAGKKRTAWLWIFLTTFGWLGMNSADRQLLYTAIVTGAAGNAAQHENIEGEKAKKRFHGAKVSVLGYSIVLS